MIDKLFMTWNETIPNQNIDKIPTITKILQKKDKIQNVWLEFKKCTWK